MRRTRVSYFFLVLFFLLALYLVKLYSEIKRNTPIDFTDFDNVLGSKQLIVPNMVHFIHFDSEKISFITFICILSAHYNQLPNIIFVHTNMDLQGRYFKTLEDVIGARLKIVRTSKPTHVFGQKLSSVQHASDVARIKIMMQYGGIILDEDVFVVKSLNSFRHFELSLGWPVGQNLGSQVLVGHKQARLLPLWLSLYQEYRPAMWYYNAGESPTRSVLEKQPGLVHRVETGFGVENLSEQLYKQDWPGWRDRHTVHLLARHQEYLTNTSMVTEDNYKDCDCTVGAMIASVMEQVRDENIVWSGEWLRLKDDSGEEGLRARVETFLAGNSKSLLHRHLSLDLFDQLENIRTPGAQGSLGDQIRSGLAQSDSSLGLYASDPEAYTYFSRLYSPVIRELHSVAGKVLQPPLYWGDGQEVGQLGGRVTATRITVSRSVQGFPFNSRMTIDDYLSLEQVAMEAFSSLSGQLAGSYRSLTSLEPAERARLVEQHLLFPPCDRFLASARACGHWPAGRGVFLNTARTFLVWVGAEDHLSIVSLQAGGDLGAVYRRLVQGVAALEDAGLAWATSPSLGHLTFCPSNLGTGLRAAVSLGLDRLMGEELREWAAREGLEVKAVAGENSGEVELFNSKRLGMTEYQIVHGLYSAVLRLLKLDSGPAPAKHSGPGMVEKKASKPTKAPKSGVKIETLKAGDGKTFPVAGQRVTCHYILTLQSGLKVDSSRERAQPFQFTLGRREVIAGWEEGLARMSLGQRARLTISPEMGYGVRGQGSIPPNSILIFDVELLNIQ